MGRQGSDFDRRAAGLDARRRRRRVVGVDAGVDVDGVIVSMDDTLEWMLQNLFYSSLSKKCYKLECLTRANLSTLG